MKTILAYGDSLTFGANPIPGGARHAYEDRWPTALEVALNGEARVIAEGLGGRTTVHDDWFANAGVARALTDDVQLRLGMMFQHLSNRGATDPNPGVNSLGVTIGLSWGF